MEPSPGQQISHYRLLEEIGSGGMGVVWKAEDTALGRLVALKLLPSEATSDPTRRQMFVDEARLASSVSHASIVQVYELGHDGDVDFIAMEYIEGQPLRSMLRGQPLAAERVARLGLQIAQGMARAHRKNLVHRDLKPANILVTPDEEVKIVDFGLAALFDQGLMPLAPEEPTRSSLNAAGRRASSPAGTLAYMAPEQLRGEPVDGRSDIFSLGVVLYELVAGARPFQGATDMALASEILGGRFRALHEIDARVPLELDRLISKALATRPADRYQTMDDLAVDLRHLLGELESGSSPSYGDLEGVLKRRSHSRRRRVVLTSVAALVLLGAGAYLIALRPWQHGAGGRTRNHTVLVIPFEVRGRTEGADFVGRAVAEAIAGRLAESNDLSVLPVPSAPAEAGHPVDARRMASAMGADRVLTGALTFQGSSVNARVNLLDPARAHLLWSTERSASDVLLSDLSFQIASETAARLGASYPKLYEAPSRVSGGPRMAVSVELANVIAAFAKDPDSALVTTRALVTAFPDEYDALVLHTLALVDRFYKTGSSADRRTLDEALAALDHIDSANPYTPIWRGWLAGLDGGFAESVAAATSVLARNDLSNSFRAWGLRRRSNARTELQQFDEAIKDSEQALVLDPSEPYSLLALSFALRRAGRYDDAVTRAQQAVALLPNEWSAYDKLGLALNRLGRDREAAIAFERACELGHSQSSCALYAGCLQRLHRVADGMEAASAAAKLPESLYGAYNLACYWALAGDTPQALYWLGRAADLGYSNARVRADSDLQSLHGNPKFEAIVAVIEKQAETQKRQTASTGRPAP